MAVQTQVVRFQKDATNVDNATQDVNFTFTPKAIVVFSECNTADNTVSDHYQICKGFSNGTNQACVVATSDDADAAADTARVHSNNRVYIRLNETNNGTIEEAATVVFATNKATFTWVTNSANATHITVWAIGGDDILNVSVNTVALGTTGTGATSFTGLGYTPVDGKAVLFTLDGATLTANLNAVQTGGAFGLGCAVSTSKRWAINNTMEDTADPTDTWRVHYIDKCLSSLVVTSGALEYHADFNGWVSDGFSLNITDAASNSTINFSYLVINGGNWDCGNLDSPAANTLNVDYTVSVNSQTIRGLMLTASGGNTASSGTIATNALMNIGATDGTTQSCISGVDEDNQATTDSYRINNTVNIHRFLTLNGADALVATFDSFPTTAAFRLDWGTSTAGNILQWVVVADAPVAVVEEPSFKSFGSLGITNTTGNTIFG